jgi:putative sigma-54 modulation protein
LLVTISGRHVDITESIRRHTEQKVSKLPKYYSNINKVEVIIHGGQSATPGVEIIASAEHNRVFVVKEPGQEIYACIDSASKKLERQLKRQKEKERDNKH